MEIFYKLIEVAVTLIEDTIIISSVVAISGRRYAIKKHVLGVWVSVVAMSLAVSGLNRIEMFSFITPIFGMLIVLLISRLLSSGSLLLRATACVTTFFVIQSIDYILFIGMGLLHGNPNETFATFMSPGTLRNLYLFLNKVTDIVVFFLLRKDLHKLSSFRNSLQGLLFGASLLSYCSMQYLFSVVLYGDYVSLQIASIISFFFLLCFMAVVIFALLSVTKSEKHRSDNEILQRTNEIMEQNYQRMHEDVHQNAKLLHDFHHHSAAIRELAAQKKTDEIIEYIDSMLSTSYEAIEFCNCSCDIINAVINCKALEARSRHIEFRYQVDFHEPTNLKPVDICAVLANQIENALEACEKIEDQDKRIVRIEIRQRDGFALFKVMNTVRENPFRYEDKLLTTKTDTSRTHGLGLKNISDIAKKYSGSMQTNYQDGMFISTVLLCFSPE